MPFSLCVLFLPEEMEEIRDHFHSRPLKLIYKHHNDERSPGSNQTPEHVGSSPVCLTPVPSHRPVNKPTPDCFSSLNTTVHP